MFNTVKFNLTSVHTVFIACLCINLLRSTCKKNQTLLIARSYQEFAGIPEHQRRNIIVAAAVASKCTMFGAYFSSSWRAAEQPYLGRHASCEF